MTNYYDEEIERITEQVIEQETYNEIKDIKNETVGFISNEKRELIKAFSEYDGFRRAIYLLVSDINKMYLDAIEYIDTTIDDTEKEIELDIRNMIVENGYQIDLSNDGSGNVNVGFVKV